MTRLTLHDRQNLDAILRDRAGMDVRIAELAQQILELQSQWHALTVERSQISDVRLADKFGVSRPAMHYHRLGRLG